MHGVQHIEQREIFGKRQAVPCRRAHVIESNIGLDKVGVLHGIHAIGIRALHAVKRPYQAACRALALQMFDQRQEWALACIQCHVVKIVKHARLREFAQLSVDKAAT